MMMTRKELEREIPRLKKELKEEYRKNGVSGDFLFLRGTIGVYEDELAKKNDTKKINELKRLIANAEKELPKAIKKHGRNSMDAIFYEAGLELYRKELAELLS